MRRVLRQDCRRWGRPVTRLPIGQGCWTRCGMTGRTTTPPSFDLPPHLAREYEMRIGLALQPRDGPRGWEAPVLLGIREGRRSQRALDREGLLGPRGMSRTNSSPGTVPRGTSDPTLAPDNQAEGGVFHVEHRGCAGQRVVGWKWLDLGSRGREDVPDDRQLSRRSLRVSGSRRAGTVGTHVCWGRRRWGRYSSFVRRWRPQAPRS
jgi:hypothetical protein